MISQSLGRRACAQAGHETSSAAQTRSGKAFTTKRYNLYRQFTIAAAAAV
jgi:hypothetical protein